MEIDEVEFELRWSCTYVDNEKPKVNHLYAAKC